MHIQQTPSRIYFRTERANIYLATQVVHKHTLRLAINIQTLIGCVRDVRQNTTLRILTVYALKEKG